MSADNWAVCPSCVRYLVSPSEPDPRTFREDYEIYVAEDGVVRVSYSGHCERCGSGVDFKTEHPVVHQGAQVSADARLREALDELSMDAAVRREHPDNDQWIAVGIDLAVHRLRAAFRDTEPAGALDRLDDVALGAALHNLKAQVVRRGGWAEGWEPLLLVDVAAEYDRLRAARLSATPDTETNK
jgi:hypothetical protein